MTVISNPNIAIQRVEKSRITGIDFNNLSFGKVFSDHMFVSDYKDGAWQNPTIEPFGNLSISPAAKVFHYGQAVFEGMKAYKDDNGSIWLFRPDENFKRINRSSERLAIPAFREDFFFEGLKALLQLDTEWIKPGEGNALYIRPFVIATECGVSASPSSEYKFIIITSPVQAYYKGEVKVVIAEHFSRAADGGVGFTKAAGNYAGQFYPTHLAKEKGFQQVIWTDANEHKYLEEAGTMNVFFRVGDTLLTAPNNDRILDGITRKSVIQLAQDAGVDVEVRRVSVAELVAAAKDGSLKEIFGSGTAAVISPIRAFSYKETVYTLKKQEDSYAQRFKKALMDIQYNRASDPYGWRHEVL